MLHLRNWYHNLLKSVVLP